MGGICHKADPNTLTLAETRIVRELASGLTRQEIADGHGVQVTSVYTQIHSAMDKLGAQTPEHLMVLAIERGIVAVSIEALWPESMSNYAKVAATHCCRKHYRKGW